MPLLERIKNALLGGPGFPQDAYSPNRWPGFVPQYGEEGGGQSQVAEACINLIVGQLAPCVRRVELDGAEVDHAVNDLLRNPWPEANSFNFWEIFIRALLVRGNSYAIVRRYGGMATMLTPAIDGGVTYDSRGRLKYTLTPINQRFSPVGFENLQIELGSGQVVAANWHGYDGLVSPSPIKRAMSIALQQRLNFLMMTLASRATETGPYWGYRTAFLEQLQSKARIEMSLAQTREAIQTLDASMKVPVIAPAMTAESMQAFSIGDLNIVEFLRWTVEDICRVYGVSPARVGQMSGGGAGVRTQALQDQMTDFERTAIRPVAAMCDAALTRALLTPEEQAVGMEVKTRTWEIGLGSMEDRANIADQLVARAMIMTPNEARMKYFGLPPIEGGDELVMPKGAPTQDIGGGMDTEEEDEG